METSALFTLIIDYIGTFAFAISGIRRASAKQFDLFGAVVVGFATACGGGTFRDLLLGKTPFWMNWQDPMTGGFSYLLVVLFALIFVIALGRWLASMKQFLFLTRLAWVCLRLSVLKNRCNVDFRFGWESLWV